MTNIIGALLIVVAIEAAAIVVLMVRGARRARVDQALHDSGERFRFVVDGGPAYIWTTGPDAKIDYANSACAEFTGLSTEELMGNGWFDAIHPDDRDQVAGIWFSAIEARTPFQFEYRVRRADGVYRWLVATGAPRYWRDGSFAGYAGCDIDINERKDAEDMVAASQRALEMSQHDIQQLAGQLLTAHEDERRRLARELHDDLTQRLARLAIDAGRMEGAPASREGARALREGLVRLSEDVHALSYRLHPSVLDDLGPVEALRTECDRVATHGALRVDVNAKGVPEPLPAEAALCLFRVAQEALSNAERHAHASTVTVLLSSNGNGLQLEVSDNGRGFNPAGPRDHASLGLASMRERVRLLHGELGIDSAPGRGTSVVARVPA